MDICDRASSSARAFRRNHLLISHSLPPLVPPSSSGPPLFPPLLPPLCLPSVHSLSSFLQFPPGPPPPMINSPFSTRPDGCRVDYRHEKNTLQSDSRRYTAELCTLVNPGRRIEFRAVHGPLAPYGLSRCPWTIESGPLWCVGVSPSLERPLL
jgi:hypothetical protein